MMKTKVNGRESEKGSAGVKFLIVFIFSTLTSWLAAGAFTKKGPPAGYNTKAPASAGA